jgi:phenylacetate-coenzyme A ligase PaaK-like adenylate-forming protein
MIKIAKLPLEIMAANKIGVGGPDLTREQINQYQLKKLRATIRLAFQRSPFYRKLLQGVAEPELTCLADLRRLPFTAADDIRRHGLQFLCASQDDISRVVTLDSSGTTGAAKRLFFTPTDQYLTIDFFQYGMAALTEPGDKVLILLPGERPGSVGDLLAKALERLGARPILYGIVRSLPETLAVIEREKVDSLVGIPTQVLALARYADARGTGSIRLKNMLLSTDHVPDVIAAELRRLWGCNVFEHYGMTEMGLGGGTACAFQAGYHLHEADFYFEIIDPATGEAVPEGQEGEVVVTTLSRKGMPLVRYRTGDISRILSGPCGCGSVLRRLERITRRRDGGVSLGDCGQFTLADLDEAIFAVEGVINFTAAVDNDDGATRLIISAVALDKHDKVEQDVYNALDNVSTIHFARQAGKLTVSVEVELCGDFLVPGAAKRTIAGLNELGGK